jgi:DNA polymerase-1
MRELRWSLNGRPWVGWIADRPEDLVTFLRWCAEQARRGIPVAVDSETTGLEIFSYGPGFLRLAQFGTEDEAWVIPVEMGPQWAHACIDALSLLPALTGHNWASFDAQVFAVHLGMGLDALCRKTIDTRILAGLIDPRQPQEGGIGTGLKPLSAHWIDPAAPDTQGGLTAVFRSLGFTKATGWAGIPLDNPTYNEYAALDVILTSRLRTVLFSELGRLAVRPALVGYEHEISRICAVMQFGGILLDLPYTRGLDAEFRHEVDHWEAEAARYGVDNVNSRSQLLDAFRGMGEVWEPGEYTEDKREPHTRHPETDMYTEVGAPSPKVDKQVLHRFADLDFQSGKRLGARTPNPLAEAVIKTKRAGKWRSAYTSTMLDTVDANGRSHPFINSMQARTARMSITRWAAQTLPSSDWRIRRCVVAEPGHRWFSVDFQAIEMRVLAALADVRRMKEGFARGNPDGSEFDIHMYTARLIKGEAATRKDRKVFKGAGFGKVYGGGATTLARQTGGTEDEMRNVMRAYDGVYPEIVRKSRSWQREARATGMVHLSVTGRRLPLDPERIYAVVNYACQSAARDCLGQSLINMEAAGLLPHLRLPIHDEVVGSVPEAEAPELTREVARAMTFELAGVPIVASGDIGGSTWGSLYMNDSNGDPDYSLLSDHDPWFAADHARTVTKVAA